MHLTAGVFMVVAMGIAKGWDCSAGCNTENGFCEKPGKCRCKPGWQGENCEQCVSFPGCRHGACEKAWQCVCQEGWVGSLCDQDTRLCSSGPCVSNATCIETGEGGYLCICPHGYAGNNCLLKRGACLTDSSPCQTGGTCGDAGGPAGPSSCSCPPGSSGDFCEAVDGCRPDPCLNGGNCTALGAAFACACPPGFSGSTCGAAAPPPCAGRPCGDRGACVGRPDGSFRCACHKRFTGPTCALRKVGARPADRRVLAPAPPRYALPAHRFHTLLRPPDRDPLKVAPRGAAPGGLAAHGQLVCFGVLALLTCLVILGSAAVVFSGRCQAWRANAKYSQLLRQQKERLLGGAGAAGRQEGEEAGPQEGGALNLILTEKIRLASFGRHYTSI